MKKNSRKFFRGDVFANIHNDLYMLVCVKVTRAGHGKENHRFTLVNLFNGNRWSDALLKSKTGYISEKKLKRYIDTDGYEMFKTKSNNLIDILEKSYKI